MPNQDRVERVTEVINRVYGTLPDDPYVEVLAKSIDKRWDEGHTTERWDERLVLAICVVMAGHGDEIRAELAAERIIEVEKEYDKS